MVSDEEFLNIQDYYQNQTSEAHIYFEKLEMLSQCYLQTGNQQELN